MVGFLLIAVIDAALCGGGDELRIDPLGKTEGRTWSGYTALCNDG